MDYSSLTYQMIRFFSVVITLFLILSIQFIPNYRSEEQVLDSHQKILYVGGNGSGNYTTIQNAIDNASEGDLVFVYSGLYYENVIVDIPIILHGENRETTSIHGGNSGDIPCIDVRSDNVIIEGFFIQWADWEYHEPGIKITSDNVIVRDNNISIHDKGISLMSSAQHSTIKNNIISYNHEGIYIWPTAAGNHIIENNYFGVCDYGLKIYNSYNLTFKNNTVIDNNFYGIEMKTTDNSVFSKNTFSSNARGITIDQGSTQNIFFHNNFISNLYHVIDQGSNQWNMTYPCGGNYWSDYTGVDADGDGIGDELYNVPGANNNKDYYPFMSPNIWSEHPLQVSYVVPQTGIIEEELFFNCSIEGGLQPYQVTWDFGDGSQLSGQFVDHVYAEEGIYDITLTVEDGYCNQFQETIELTIIETDEIPPEVSVCSPRSGLQYHNTLLFSFSFPLSCVIGDFDVIIESHDEQTSITSLNVFINNILIDSTSSSNYTFSWPSTEKGFHILSVEAIDRGENKAQAQLNILAI